MKKVSISQFKMKKKNHEQKKNKKFLRLFLKKEMQKSYNKQEASKNVIIKPENCFFKLARARGKIS